MPVHCMRFCVHMRGGCKESRKKKRKRGGGQTECLLLSTKRICWLSKVCRYVLPSHLPKFFGKPTTRRTMLPLLVISTSLPAYIVTRLRNGGPL